MSSEKKYTEEEIKTIVNKEIRKANLKPAGELTPEEMETVSGGLPETHEEIDRRCDIIQVALNEFGTDVATCMMKELDCLPPEFNAGERARRLKFSTGSVNELREYLHRRLDSKEDIWIPGSF